MTRTTRMTCRLWKLFQPLGWARPLFRVHQRWPLKSFELLNKILEHVCNMFEILFNDFNAGLKAHVCDTVQLTVQTQDQFLRMVKVYVKLQLSVVIKVINTNTRAC